MIYLYLIALVVGGGLLGASIVLGGHDAPGHDVHGAEHLAPAGKEGPLGGAESYLYWLVSVRFWTFFVAFFGLTGLVFDGLGLVASQWVTLVIAVAVGTTSGSSAMLVLRKLTTDDANSAVETRDYVGRTGRVLVGFAAGGVGKVRLEVKGSSIDLLAMPEDDRSYSPNDEIIVVEMSGLHAKVAHVRPSIPPAA
jgi:membrane protein implicated in regulation of membrane protease activity